jgi:hypothetical protein
MTKAEAVAKIKKLQALCSSSTFPPERANARKRIRALKTRYEITAADLKEPKPKKAKRARGSTKKARRSPGSYNEAVHQAWKIEREIETKLREAAHNALDELFEWVFK